MSLAAVKKVEILAHSGLKMDLLSALQEEGVIQIERIDSEGLGLISNSPQVSEIDHTLFRLSHALDSLSPWEEKSFKTKLLGGKPGVEAGRRRDVLDFEYEDVLTRVESLEKEKNELRAHLKFLEKEVEFLVPLMGLDLPVLDVRSTETTNISIGTLPVSKLEELEEQARDGEFWFEEISRTKRLAYVLVIVSKSSAPQVDQRLKDLDFMALFFTEPLLEKVGAQDCIPDLIQKIDAEEAEAESRLGELEKIGQELAVHRDDLMRVYDVLQNEKEKLLSSRLLGESESAFVLEGWIQDKDIPRLRDRLKPHSELIELYFRDPHPDEEPPAVLENPKGGRPFEIITKLYGLPKTGTMDPTMALAPFFFLYVGITVSEAGYGFLVALMSLVYLKFAKPQGGIRQFLQLMVILSVSTVIIGTLIGGWFGFPVRRLMILDPLADPLSFLGISLGLGFVQVWFGTLLKMISELKNKNTLQALFVQGGWLLLLPSLVLYGVLKHQILGWLCLVGAAGIVFFAAPSRNPLARFFGGLYRLYDISRYLADILSYSRLLALGLATSVIAMVVNTLCQTALRIPWVGWLFAALIFAGGHLFNLGISFLGGFVHSMRLQFVEFFSKFFESGGKPFKPFELESKYVEFSK